MQVRRKLIGGKICYEIVEAFDYRGEVEYRSVVQLGTDSDPQEALRKHQTSLIDAARALKRLQPLQDADHAIRRKCDTLKSRLKTEQERIGLLIDAIERLDEIGDKEPETAEP